MGATRGQLTEALPNSDRERRPRCDDPLRDTGNGAPNEPRGAAADGRCGLVGSVERDYLSAVGRRGRRVPAAPAAASAASVAASQADPAVDRPAPIRHASASNSIAKQPTPAKLPRSTRRAAGRQKAVAPPRTSPRSWVRPRRLDPGSGRAVCLNWWAGRRPAPRPAQAAGARAVGGRAVGDHRLGRSRGRREWTYVSRE